MELKLSKHYEVRKLGINDIDMIYEMCRENTIFYQYHPPFVTRESIREDMSALPPGKDYQDKYYVGFFENEQLAAIMDLILKYPNDETALIGLFMTNVQFQRKGVGSAIINELLICLKEIGYKKIRIGVDKGNPQSNSFWAKNGFVPIGEKNDYIVMERTI